MKENSPIDSPDNSAGLTENELALNDMRTKSDEMFAERAEVETEKLQDEADNSRTLMDKILGRNKVNVEDLTSVDMAQKHANMINEAVDNSGSIDDEERLRELREGIAAAFPQIDGEVGPKTAIAMKIEENLKFGRERKKAEQLYKDLSASRPGVLGIGPNPSVLMQQAAESINAYIDKNPLSADEAEEIQKQAQEKHAQIIAQGPNSTYAQVLLDKQDKRVADSIEDEREKRKKETDNGAGLIKGIVLGTYGDMS